MSKKTPAEEKIKVEAAPVEPAADVLSEEEMAANVDAVMKKYDRESNVRIWEGAPKWVVTGILAAFSLFCIYVTLYAVWLEEVRLTSFVALIVLMGFIVFPAKKGVQKVNFMPWYDIVLMVAGTGAFLYFTFLPRRSSSRAPSWRSIRSSSVSSVLRRWLRSAAVRSVCRF